MVGLEGESDISKISTKLSALEADASKIEIQQLVSLLQQNHETDGVGKRSLKDHAMSHFPEDKRGPPYQWDYRSSIPFCGGPPQSWPPIPLALPHSNPYYSNPHLVHPHLGQWTAGNKLPQAHSQSKLSSPEALMKDLQPSVDDAQVETVDLSARSQTTVKLTVDKEITSTEDVPNDEEKGPESSEPADPLQAGGQQLVSPNNNESPTHNPGPAPAPALARHSEIAQVSQSEETPDSIPAEVRNDEIPPQAPILVEPPTIVDSAPNEATEPTVSASVVGPVADSLPTVSSTSTDVKPTSKDNRKRKKVMKKRPRETRTKAESKAVKTAKLTTTKVERRGPALRLTGSREKPLTVQLINGPRTEDDSRTHQPDLRGPRNGLFSSTLSARYDAHTRDPTWICVFCKKGPHYRGLGDLFGPYVVSREANEELCDFSGDERDIVETQKRGGRHKKSIRANHLVDHFQNMSRRLKRMRSCDGAASMAGLTPITQDGGEDERFEVWIHELCVIWGPGVCLLDTRLLGLQEAVWHCHQSMCSKCGLMGANLGCIHRNCPNRSHYICALESGWNLPIDSFISTCHFHVQR